MLGQWLGRVLKVVLALAGVVFTLSLLVVGLLVAAAFILLSLLRGRKPALRWQTVRQGGASLWRQAPGAQPAAAQRGEAGDVVDVEAREVPASHQAIRLD
ncbi:MAG: hypothetical protein RJA98_3621 [Pseudomonadota bacterium]|jgi:hypothetical protein